jgi:hypothetical protein
MFLSVVYLILQLLAGIGPAVGALPSASFRIHYSPSSYHSALYILIRDGAI